MNPQANRRCKRAVELMVALQLCLSLTPAPTWAASLPNDLSAGQQLLYCAHLYSFRQKGKAGYLEYRADVLAVVRPAVLRYITPERFDAESEDVRLFAWHSFRGMSQLPRQLARTELSVDEEAWRITSMLTP